MLKITFCACLSLAIAAAQPLPKTCPAGTTANFPNPQSLAIDSCGLPGSADPKSPEGLQNDKKNNFCTQGAATAIDVAKLTGLQASAAAQEAKLKYKAGTPPPDRSFLKPLGEGNLVVFEGYVFEARQECAESVNCEAVPTNVDASHDIHIALVGQPRKTNSQSPKPAQDAEECTGFVAEMIPHHRPAEWSACNVNAVGAKGLRVRITGQQFFDGSHVPCQNGVAVGDNPKRVSLWEIHPIYAFEVCPSGDCKSGGWEKLELFAAGKTSCQNKPCELKTTAVKKSSPKK
jgi:hypothetical protein